MRWPRQSLVALVAALVAASSSCARVESNQSGASVAELPEMGRGQGAAGVSGALKDPTGALTGKPDDPPDKIDSR
jgi:hypothetical protein